MATTPRQVISENYPTIRVAVKFRKFHSEGAALLDTGFTGHVAIPTYIFNGDLGLPDFTMAWKLADGSKVKTPAYRGIMRIVGLTSLPAVITVLGDEYMLGREVIDRLRVTFDRGKRIIIQR